MQSVSADFIKHFDNDLESWLRTEMERKMSDNVNHPSHYETGKFECIDVMLEVFGKEKVMAFCQCNAFKYLYRMDRKNGIEDLEKARWYINKYQELAND